MQTRVVALLREVATAGGTITYEDLRERLGLAGDLVPVLRAASIAEDEAGRGLLSAVVVQAASGRPGAGWFRLAADRGRDVSDEEAAWQAERRLLAAEH